MTPLFVVRFNFGVKPYTIAYESLEDCLRDTSLARLLDQRETGEVKVWRDQHLVFNLPATISSWRRFRSELVDHAATLLKGYGHE